MAAEGSQRSLKRFSEDNDGLCPAKLRRKESDHDVGSRDGCGVDPGVTTAATCVSLGKEPMVPAFVKDSVDPISALDCTFLLEVLQTEELMVSDKKMEAPPADVFVPGSAFYARISWNCLLAQIGKRLSLKIHDFGYVHAEGTGVECWICVETPVKGVVPAKEIQRFMGGGHSRYDAMESACKAAVRFLRRSCDVIVLDANYADMKAMEKRAKRAEDFSSMYIDMIAARDKREAVMHARYAGVFASAKELCKEFSDILPVKVNDIASPFTSAQGVEVVYAGPRPPITRMDQLTFALVSLLSKGSNLGVGSRNVM